ncbi:MAG: arginine--tRNA ligase [Candidatus Nomurabacteria bacterium]|nr:arginine--tRNA ligase [Candidatus Nomurabacteria bacterium]
MNIKTQIQNIILEALKNLGIEASAITLEHPADLNNGDYSTNVAMAYAKQSSKNPRALADEIKSEIEKNLPKEISKIEVAGAGFINFYLSHDFFVDSIKDILNKGENWGKNDLSNGKKIMVEYTDPNPFKPFHIGHLMTNAIGESISRIVEFSGAKTVRANYQGDVGLHVAKAIWGMMKNPERDQENEQVSYLASYIGNCYAKGSDAYDNDENSKKEIDAINKKVYDKSDEEINKIYAWGREVTLLAFEEIYSLLGTKFNHYFFESIMAPIGEKIVRANTPNVFEESDGAIVFKADKYNPKLHTRVFITSSGLPLYETKEIGLTMTKFETESDLDLSIVTTAIEQGEYMKVVQQAISLMHPELEKKMKHITHGMMRLASGKMSSRKGNVVTGESLLRDSMDVVHEKVAERDLSSDEKENIAQTVGVAALKYSILRSSLGSDIVYDFEKSISFDGDSGPYLQYTAVRANGIHKKADGDGITAAYTDIPTDITVLEKNLYRFPEVVAYAYEQLEPHHIATYLTELASAFNSFYGNTVIANKNDPYAPYRVALVSAFHTTMQNGLYLLGIKTPEKM